MQVPPGKEKPMVNLLSWLCKHTNLFVVQLPDLLANRALPAINNA
jgi:hypothetical protein